MFSTKALRPDRKRQLVGDARAVWKVSIRRACRVFEVDASTYHYRPRSPHQAPLRRRIREIAETGVRDGYRRVHVPSCRTRHSTARSCGC